MKRIKIQSYQQFSTILDNYEKYWTILDNKYSRIDKIRFFENYNNFFDKLDVMDLINNTEIFNKELVSSLILTHLAFMFSIDEITEILKNNKHVFSKIIDIYNFNVIFNNFEHHFDKWYIYYRKSLQDGVIKPHTRYKAIENHFYKFYKIYDPYQYRDEDNNIENFKHVISALISMVFRKEFSKLGLKKHTQYNLDMDDWADFFITHIKNEAYYLKNLKTWLHFIDDVNENKIKTIYDEDNITRLNYHVTNFVRDNHLFEYDSFNNPENHKDGVFLGRIVYIYNENLMIFHSRKTFNEYVRNLLKNNLDMDGLLKSVYNYKIQFGFPEKQTPQNIKDNNLIKIRCPDKTLFTYIKKSNNF